MDFNRIAALVLLVAAAIVAWVAGGYWKANPAEFTAAWLILNVILYFAVGASFGWLAGLPLRWIFGVAVGVMVGMLLVEYGTWLLPPGAPMTWYRLPWGGFAAMLAGLATLGLAGLRVAYPPDEDWFDGAAS
jgi:hypothetical protein